MDSTVRPASLSTFMICWRTFSASAPDLDWANCWRSFSASSLAWATCWARFSASLGPQPVDRNTTNRLTSSKTIRFINVLLFAPFRDYLSVTSHNSNNANPGKTLAGARLVRLCHLGSGAPVCRDHAPAHPPPAAHFACPEAPARFRLTSLN